MTTMTRLAASIQSSPMFRDRTNAIATTVLGAAIVYAGYRFVTWGVINAIWSLPRDASSQACRAIRGDNSSRLSHSR